MSCGCGVRTFRLLDALVGWDPSSVEGLTGVDDIAGLVLEEMFPGAVDPNALWPYLPPPNLAHDCRACEWFLATPAPPASRLLHLTPCSRGWIPVHSGSCHFSPLREAVAIAARGGWLLVSDRASRRIWVFQSRGRRLAGEIAFAEPGPVAFRARNEILVARVASDEIHRFSLDGAPLGLLRGPGSGEIERMAVGRDGAIWIATRGTGGDTQLWVTRAGVFAKATLDEIAGVFEPTTLAAVSDSGFGFETTGPDGLPIRCQYTWSGRCLDAWPGPVSPQSRRTQGQLLTTAIDSGVPRCRWHRVRLDADIPPGTSVAVAVASADDPDLPAEGDPAADPAWSSFEAGNPHASDWHSGPSGSTDFLIDQPAGRYLFVRIRLTGDGFSTPRLRRVRLDFPRVTSLEFLPPVYRENPDAEDFTERFLSLFDAIIEETDTAIQRYPSLLDVEGTPAETLPWLSSFVDVFPEREWGVPQRREILRSVPDLYRKRGTPDGIRLAIRLVFGVDASVEELGLARNWGAVGHSAVLGGVRLFGKSRARFRLGRSSLGLTPLKTSGRPDLDPWTADAYRLRVLAPAHGPYGAIDPARLARLVNAQKPAHTTVSTLRVGRTGFHLDGRLSLGIDTVFSAPPAPVIGKTGNVRLGRGSVLWTSGNHPQPSLTVGGTSIAGTNTYVE